jgi:hypothetical protein
VQTIQGRSPFELNFNHLQGAKKSSGIHKAQMATSTLGQIGGRNRNTSREGNSGRNPRGNV